MWKTKLFSFVVTKMTTIKRSSFVMTENGEIIDIPIPSIDGHRSDKTVVAAVMRYIREAGAAGATADMNVLVPYLSQCNAKQLSQIEIASTFIFADLSSATDGLWNHFFIKRFGFQSAYLLVEKMEQQGVNVSISWRQMYDESAEAEKKPPNPIKKVYKILVDLFKKLGPIHAGGGEEEEIHVSMYECDPIEVKQNIIKLHPMIKWEDCPKYLWCKLQVDGAVVTGTLSKQAGAGGVLTRGDGKNVAAYSYHLGDVSLRYAKVWALWHGLMLTEIMEIEYLIVETDSMFVAETLNWQRNHLAGFLTNFQEMIRHFREILPENCTLQMIRSESNAIARKFAEIGAANK